MSSPPLVSSLVAPDKGVDDLSASEAVTLRSASPRPHSVHPSISTYSAPPFLSTLSPQKSAALTETSKSLALAEASHPSSTTTTPLVSPSVTSHDDIAKLSLGGSRLLEDRSAVHETLPHGSSHEERPGKLSLRLGSAMNTSLAATGPSSPEHGILDSPGAEVTILDANESKTADDAPADAPAQDTPSPSGTLPMTLDSADGQDNEDPFTKGQRSEVQREPSRGPAWTSWTSRAASGSLSILKQSTITAAGWGSALATNPFRAPSSSKDLESSNSSQVDAGPSRARSTTESDDDDVMIAKSAADALRSEAKEEEKRRAAQARSRQKEGGGKSRADEKRTESDKERGRPQRTTPSWPMHITQGESSSSDSRSSSPTVPGLNTFDYSESWPGACDPPTGGSLPERRYFILSQAGKPVFLSHLAARRMEREDTARLRLRALRKMKKQRDGQKEALSPESEDYAEQLLGLKNADEEADAIEDAARARDQAATDAEEEEGAIQVGVLQALISNYLEQGQAVLESKSIEVLQLPRSSSRVVYLARAPLYLAVTSTWHDGGQIYADSATVLKAHLEVLHAGLISLISESQLRGLFARGYNFDLRRMLEGTDGILSSLVARCQSDFGLILGAGGGGGICLRPTRLDLKLREDLGSCLSLERWQNRPLSTVLAGDTGRSSPSLAGETLKVGSDSSHTSAAPELDPSKLKLEFKVPARPKDLLYILLITSDGQLITMLRPRRLSAYPLDLHLLMNTIVGMSRRTQREPGTVNWIPICLPRFAPQGMVQAHISWLRGEPRQQQPQEKKSDQVEEEGGSEAEEEGRRNAECALVIVTADRESFDEIGIWRDGVVQALSLPPSPLASLSHALTQAAISPDSLRLPGLRHFVLKKKDDLQIVWSDWIDPYLGESTFASLARDRVRKAYARGRELSVLGAKMGRSGKKARREKQSAPAGDDDDKHSSAPSNKATNHLQTGVADKAGSSVTNGEADTATIEDTSSSQQQVDPSNSAEGEEGKVPVRPLPSALVAQANLTSHYFRTPYEAFYIEVPPVGSTASPLTGPLIAEVDSASPYEVYLTLSPNVPPATARKIARQVIRWGLGSRVSGLGGGDAAAGERWRLFVSGRGMVF